MLLVQKWPLFQLFFLGNIGQENVFYNILERKNAHLGYKNNKLKKPKIDIYPKGLHHGFGPKMAIFPTAFLRLNRAGKWVWRYSTTKNVFLGYKNKKFKKPKIWRFFKGVNPWFLSKKGHFSTFCFRQYRSGKCLLRYFRTKKRLSTL